VSRSHYRSCELIVSISQTLEERGDAGTASASLNARLDEMEKAHAAEQEELIRDARAGAEETENQLITRVADNDAKRTADSIHGAYKAQCEWKNKKDAEDEATGYVEMEAAYEESWRARALSDKVMSCAAKSWQSYQEVYPGEEGRVKAQLFELNMHKGAIDSLMESLAEISMGVQEDGGQEGSSGTVVPRDREATSLAYY